MRRALILVVLLALPLSAGKKKSMGVMYRKPGQKIEIPNAAITLGVAHRKCENYVWAAIVESMSRAQQAVILQEQWSIRTSGGEKCFPSLNDYAQRAQSLGGDYALDGGQKVRIRGEYQEGPAPSGAMLNSLRLGHPLMLVWNGRPYLLYGIVYDELIHSSGKANAFLVREFHLLDASLPVNDPKRVIVVKKDGDDDGPISGITGVMALIVEPRNFYDMPSK